MESGREVCDFCARGGARSVSGRRADGAACQRSRTRRKSSTTFIALPFNDGKGGTAEPIVGASQNGMSNNFPKVSPDGKWIVFVECHNGQLMRPDSQLYIVPLRAARRGGMQCKHAPDEFVAQLFAQRALAGFFLEGGSPYTQMYLTHIDADGNDSPADSDRQLHRCQSRSEYSGVCEHRGGWN